jgi:flavodoxin
MKLAIVYETHTGTTSAAAEKMAEVVRVAGHECTVESISNADPKKVGRADAVVIGCWTKGYFVFGQHPSEGVLKFTEGLTLSGRPVAVFGTYKLAIGSTLRQLAMVAESAGGKVTGMYKVKGPNVPAGFEAWVASLDSGAAI